MSHVHFKLVSVDAWHGTQCIARYCGPCGERLTRFTDGRRRVERGG